MAGQGRERHSRTEWMLRYLDGAGLEESVHDVLVCWVHALVEVPYPLLHYVSQPSFPHTLNKCLNVTQLCLQIADSVNFASNLSPFQAQNLQREYAVQTHAVLCLQCQLHMKVCADP